MASYAPIPSVVIAATPVPSGRCTVNAWIVNGPNFSSSRGDRTAPSGEHGLEPRPGGVLLVGVGQRGPRLPMLLVPAIQSGGRPGGGDGRAAGDQPAELLDRRDRVEGQGGHGAVGSLAQAPKVSCLTGRRPTSWSCRPLKDQPSGRPASRVSTAASTSGEPLPLSLSKSPIYRPCHGPDDAGHTPREGSRGIATRGNLTATGALTWDFPAGEVCSSEVLRTAPTTNYGRHYI